ncbi:TRX1 [Cyberlindnera jadinii]|uniref:TRX1 protein n=1 Tax=Cyberlindnera jadinii (strain ATCC 18201 / CBS 1600 / BCRC 20928 / JCM 3617 / NBRC 0987 / NRRL Y-1542) TaxID=983966 RepID=A0A0H5CDI8_CYBJN|nr:TRX1 [Cyberlindnera jadinii]
MLLQSRLARPVLSSLKATKATALRFQSTIKEVENLQKFRELIDSPKLTITDFYATWCGPCKAISPVLEKFNQEYTDVQFLKVDVDQAQDIAMEYGITAMPTFVLFKDNDALGKIVGANPSALKKAIEEYK